MSSIWIKQKKKVISVDLSSVLFIKGDKCGCTFFVKLKDNDKSLINKVRTHNTISTTETLMKRYGHIRCHRNFIINPILAVNFCKQTSTISIEGVDIPVSRRKRKEVENILQQ